MTFDGLVTSDDTTYVIFENCKVFLFETEALRALAQGESSYHSGTCLTIDATKCELYDADFL